MSKLLKICFENEKTNGKHRCRFLFLFFFPRTMWPPEEAEENKTCRTMERRFQETLSGMALQYFLFVCFFMNEALERFGLLIRPGLFILMAIFPCLLRKRAGRPNQQRSLELNVHYVNINSTFPLEKNFCAIAPIQEE